MGVPKWLSHGCPKDVEVGGPWGPAMGSLTVWDHEGPQGLGLEVPKG